MSHQNGPITVGLLFLIIVSSFFFLGSSVNKITGMATLPGACPSRIETALDKQHYNVNDVLTFTIRILDNNGNPMPNQVFYINKSLNGGYKWTRTFVTNSNGIYEFRGTVTSESIGDDTYLTYVNVTGCPYISDTAYFDVPPTTIPTSTTTTTALPSVCPSRIETALDKQHYNVNDVLTFTIRILDNNGNPMPNQLFYINKSLNGEYKWTRAYETASNGIRELRLTVTSESIGDDTYLTYVNVAGCDYISDTAYFDVPPTTIPTSTTTTTRPPTTTSSTTPTLSPDTGTFIVVLTNLLPPLTLSPDSFAGKAYGTNPPGSSGAGFLFRPRSTAPSSGFVGWNAINVPPNEYSPIFEGKQYIFSLTRLQSDPYYHGGGYFGGNLYWLLEKVSGYAMPQGTVMSPWFTPVDRGVYAFNVSTGNIKQIYTTTSTTTTTTSSTTTTRPPTTTSSTTPTLSPDTGTFIVVLTNLPPPYHLPPGSYYGEYPPGSWGADFLLRPATSPPVSGFVGWNGMTPEGSYITNAFAPISEGMTYMFHLTGRAGLLADPYYHGGGYFGGMRWWLMSEVSGYAQDGGTVMSSWFTPVDRGVYEFDVSTGNIKQIYTTTSTTTTTTSTTTTITILPVGEKLGGIFITVYKGSCEDKCWGSCGYMEVPGGYLNVPGDGILYDGGGIDITTCNDCYVNTDRCFNSDFSSKGVRCKNGWTLKCHMLRSYTGQSTTGPVPHQDNLCTCTTTGTTTSAPVGKF